MGYRNKIAILDIAKREEIKDMTIDQLKKSYNKDYVSCYEISKEVYEIGKYWDHDFLMKFKRDIFTNPDTNNFFNEESEFYIIGKDGLAAIIEAYRLSIVKYFDSVLNPKLATSVLDINPQKYLESKAREWDNKSFKPYNLDLTSEEIVSSWTHEYAIFELVRIYKSIDETKQLICITGW